jgi:hypothetical protein
MNNLSFYDSHVKICIESSKTDIYRQGNIVIIAKTNIDTCPVKLLAHYCKIAKTFLFFTGLNNKDKYTFGMASLQKQSSQKVKGYYKPRLFDTDIV